jgi:hypothetical protein
MRLVQKIGQANRDHGGAPDQLTLAFGEDSRAAKVVGDRGQDIAEAAAASLGAYNFPWAISRSTCFSSDRSATSFFSRPFSSSSCFSRLA